MIFGTSDDTAIPVAAFSNSTSFFGVASTFDVATFDVATVGGFNVATFDVATF